MPFLQKQWSLSVHCLYNSTLSYYECFCNNGLSSTIYTPSATVIIKLGSLATGNTQVEEYVEDITMHVNMSSMCLVFLKCLLTREY